MIAHACAAATAAESGEKSADYDLAVRLNRQRIDNVVRARIEAVHAAVRGESPDMFACGRAHSATAEGEEASPETDLPIGFTPQRFHFRFATRSETIDAA